MRATKLKDLCNPESIGGKNDNRRALTQRILILTESEQLGGKKKINDVRLAILEAYVSDKETTVSKHRMNVCNDIARYYRTLFLDYKSRVESKPVNWAEGHAKLLTPRKIWYFSTLLAVSKRIVDAKKEHNKIFDCLVETFLEPPVLRLACIRDKNTDKHIAEILRIFSNYLNTMSDQDYRDSLEKVTYEYREKEKLENGDHNPYQKLCKSHRELSKHMLDLLRAMPDDVQDKILRWFLL